MSIPLVGYASDEDVALVAPDDLAGLIPADQVVVRGNDGVFDASDRWTLQSASVDFLAAGLRDGHVVRLVGPAEPFGEGGTLLGVAGVTSGSVTLRRLGMEPGQGAPVAPAGGLSGVAFVATTLEPQLSQASRELDRLLAHNGAPDPDGTIRDAVVRLVLARRYALSAGDGSGNGTSLDRSRMFREEFEAILYRLFFATPPDAARILRFGTRVVR